MYGFDQRIAKHQPTVAPDDIKRYFITPEESGELCVMSCILGKNSEIFFPKLSEKLQLTSFSDLAKKYLKELGYKPIVCSSEEEARKLTKQISKNKEWPCLFTKSDTTGEKDFEEFFTDGEELDLEKFNSIGIVKNNLSFDEGLLINFIENINNFLETKSWNKDILVKIFEDTLPHFSHKETGKYPDDKNVRNAKPSRNMSLIIAEAGVNHNGSEDIAFDLIDVAQAAGADIVKFQTFKSSDLVTQNAKSSISVNQHKK